MTDNDQGSKGEVRPLVHKNVRLEEKIEDEKDEKLAAEESEAQQSNSATEPSGPKGDDPSTAGPGPTKVKSETPENRLGHINPSAPEDANTTPGTSGEK